MCDPWPEWGPLACAEDEAQLPGEAECTRIGTACTDDPWASGLPEDRMIRYVLARADAGGDGTRTAPFATIAEALTGAPIGTIVAVSKGTFDEAIVLPTGLTLWGACVAETLVASSVPAEDGGTVEVRGMDVAVQNVRLGGRRPAVWMTAPGSLALRDVVVADAQFAAIVVAVGRATLDRVLVRDTRRSDTGSEGRGLTVRGGAVVTGRKVRFERNADAGVLVAGTAESGPSTLTLEDAAVLQMSDVHVGDGMSNGLEVTDGGVAIVRRTVLGQNSGRAVSVGNSDTPCTLSLEDVLVRNTLCIATSRGRGYGLGVGRQGNVHAVRSVFEGNHEIAVLAEEDAQLHLTDIVIRDTRARPSNRNAGFGIVVEDRAVLAAARLTLERNRVSGISIEGPEAVAALADVLVRGTFSEESTGEAGFGLAVLRGAEVELHRALLEDNRTAAILVALDGASLTATDVVIRRTLSRESDGRRGSGLIVQSAASADIGRALFDGNREVAVSVAGIAASVALTNGVVRNTTVSDAAGLFGHGVGVYAGATLVLRNFTATHNALCGIQLAFGKDPATGDPAESGGTMDLYDGEVAFNTVCGANVQTAGFDLRRLQNNVRWHDNGIDLDTRELPVPEAIGGL
jgi:hypothetical protein